MATLHAELNDAGDTIILIAVGDDWEVDFMAAALRKITPALSPSKPKGALLCPLSWAAVVQLGHTFTGASNSAGWWAPGEKLRAWIAAEAARRLTEPPPLKLTLPDTLVPREYQTNGARLAAQAGKFLLFDDPGLGKTITTILALRERQERGENIFPAIIVVPSWDVADNWAREITKWAPEWRTELWGGPDRLRLLRFGLTWDVLLTTYATARRDATTMIGPLVKLKPRAVVADEVHWIKSNDAKQSQAVRRITAHATSFAGLSGTPITRDTGDLFPTLATIEPTAWTSKERMVKRYCLTMDDDYGEGKIKGLNPATEPEFRAVLTGSHRRVAKADVLPELPPKIYSTRYVDLPEGWRKAYTGMEEQMLADLPDGQELPAMDVLSQMSHLGQMASAAFDVEMEEKLDEKTGLMKTHYHIVLKPPSWKADVLLEIMAERPGQPVVAFAPSRQLIMIAGQLAGQAGYRTGYVTGLGNGVTRATRKQAIADLDAGKLDLLAVTTRAGGTGLNLTAAGTAVFLQRPLPLDDAMQAEDRVHRIGSEIHPHGVEIIDVIATDSIDTRYRALLRAKAGQLAELVRDPRIVRELLGGKK